MAIVDARARNAVRGLAAYQPGLPIDDVKRRYRLASVIKLASNENALGPSPKAVAALKQAAGSLHRYPDAMCRGLRAALAKRLRCDPSSLVFGNGSDELIVLALRAFVDPGDEVVVAAPTFLIYELQAKACGATVRVVPLRDCRYDLKAMQQAVTAHTKLVFIANPDNPTGTYVTTSELERFLHELPGHPIVMVDEAYQEFVDARDYPQTLSYLDEHPLIVTRTFSKAYGLAGLRIGYGITRPEIAAALESVREPFNVNSLAQVAACAALTDTAFLRKSLRLVREGRRYLLSEFARLGLRSIPSVTNFLLVQVGPRSIEIAEALLAHGVIVREMSGWQLGGYIRVTFGTMPENRRFVAALRRCFTV